MAALHRSVPLRVLACAIAMTGFVSFSAPVVAQTPAATSEPVTIVAFGDSLTAGYQLKPEDAFPAQLQMALRAKGYKVTVVNAGVSGDTTSAGLERLDWTLQEKADAVILELGANDALRGSPADKARENLDRIVTGFKAKGMDVLIAGMRAPGNWGRDYKTTFDGMYADIAKRHDALLYPYFLEGVEVNSPDVLGDGLHPSASGIAKVVAGILPDVEKLIARVAARKSAGKT
jgi:acyl-CoA thioesterase-1